EAVGLRRHRVRFPQVLSNVRPPVLAAQKLDGYRQLPGRDYLKRCPVGCGVHTRPPGKDATAVRRDNGAIDVRDHRALVIGSNLTLTRVTCSRASPEPARELLY